MWTRCKASTVWLLAGLGILNTIYQAPGAHQAIDPLLAGHPRIAAWILFLCFVGAVLHSPKEKH